MAADASLDADTRRVAAELHERYAYPVDTQVLAPDGELLGRRKAGGASREPYDAFLAACLEEANRR